MTYCTTADIGDRDDLEMLLRRFYGRAFADETLDEPFADLRAEGLDSHLPVMCDFWETVLFGAGLYHGNALAVHRELAGRHPLHARDFAAWLSLWTSTVDEMYCGPVADRAKLQATRMAGALQRRLTSRGAADERRPARYRR